MSLVFKAQEGTGDVEIVGVGLVPATSEGVAVDPALIPELWETDEAGRPTRDETGAPVPLSGSALDTAAAEFAESRGLEIADVSDERLAEIAAEGNRPPLSQVGEEHYLKTWGGVVPEGEAGPSADEEPIVPAPEPEYPPGSP